MTKSSQILNQNMINRLFRSCFFAFVKLFAIKYLSWFLSFDWIRSFFISLQKRTGNCHCCCIYFNYNMCLSNTSKIHFKNSNHGMLVFNLIVERDYSIPAVLRKRAGKIALSKTKTQFHSPGKSAVPHISSHFPSIERNQT